MATKSPLRLAALSLRRPPPPPPTTTKRTFLSSLLAAATADYSNNNGNDKPLHIHVSRHLPYPRAQLYELIADVDSYARFLPYCKHSRVTAWGTAAAAATNNKNNDETTTIPKKWPTAGELALGWGPLDHTYTSRIVCVPGHSVEAHSGQDEPLCRHEDQRRGYRNPFRKLSTRWALRDAATAAAANTNTTNTNNTRTTVDLDINMTLHDAMTQAVLSQMVDGVAAEMIEAFEKRAEQMFGPK